MRSSANPPEESTPPERPVLLVAEGGVHVEDSSERDPFERLDDLMAVVEALCPVRPARPMFGPMRDMRL
jgi:hypothetical protein